MKQTLLIAGAAMLAFASPAVAKPGNGHGQGHHLQQQGQGSLYGYGVGGCPPGLAKKTPACLPPGQARKLYNVGQRLPLGYASPYAYNQIPYDLRSQYGLNPYGSYYNDGGYLYQADPRTMVIQQVLGAILR